MCAIGGVPGGQGARLDRVTEETTTGTLARLEIPARERATLRNVVRTQYRVLRSEIETRVAELKVEAAKRSREKYAQEDADWAKLAADVRKVIARAQKQVDALVEAAPVKPDPGYSSRTPKVSIEYLYKPTNAKRKKLEEEFSAAIGARARQAKLQFDREEADALRYLAADEVKSEKAKQFLDTIPSIQTALPTSTLAEVEVRVTGF